MQGSLDGKVDLVEDHLRGSPGAVVHFIQGTSPAEVALTRYLVCVVLCWMALAIVSFVVGPAPGQVTPQDVQPADAATT